LTADADSLVRELIVYGTPFQDLEVRPVSLEEAVLTALRGTHGDVGSDGN
tara:strand:- start:8865 stop:9014 length:150 start_codon:yes stop_codon:yes gene_type:complete